MGPSETIFIHGFLSFCKCFFLQTFHQMEVTSSSPESKSQCIGIHFQHAKAHLWWNFISYRLWPKKSGQANKYSEKAYRDVPLKIFFSGEENGTRETVTVPGKTVIAWENSRRFARSPLEPSQNNVWVTSSEIPYWWCAQPRSRWCFWLVERKLPRCTTN